MNTAHIYKRVHTKYMYEKRATFKAPQVPRVVGYQHSIPLPMDGATSGTLATSIWWHGTFLMRKLDKP